MRETKTTSLVQIASCFWNIIISCLVIDRESLPGLVTYTESTTRRPIAMSSSIGSLVGSQCGSTSSKVNISPETIPISLCKRDVTDISTEYDLILSRAGVFDYDEDFLSRTTVCPRHRYQIGRGWCQKRVCRYPDHKGKARPDRSISKLQSQIIFQEFKHLAPVGSGKDLFYWRFTLLCNVVIGL